MRISVVIGAWNAAELLGQTLSSVAAQTFAPHEVIVVDDGSTDATAAVAAAHGARVISTPNRGVSAARNTGIEQAGGDWIALLDADDLWTPDKLALQVEAAALAPDAGVVVCDHYQFHGEGELIQGSILDERRARYDALQPQRLAPAMSRLPGMGTRLVSLGMAFFPSTWLVRRDLARAIGGFDAGLRRCEDYEFLLRALARSDLVVVEKSLMGYRIHAQNISRVAEAMTDALIDIGERIGAHPQRYAPGAARAFAPRMHEVLLESASLRLGRGDRTGARERIARAGSIRRDRRWLELFVASRLPPGARALVARLHQRLRGARR